MTTSFPPPGEHWACSTVRRGPKERNRSSPTSDPWSTRKFPRKINSLAINVLAIIILCPTQQLYINFHTAVVHYHTCSNMYISHSHNVKFCILHSCLVCALFISVTCTSILLLGSLHTFVNSAKDLLFCANSQTVAMTVLR